VGSAAGAAADAAATVAPSPFVIRAGRTEPAGFAGRRFVSGATRSCRSSTGDAISTAGAATGTVRSRSVLATATSSSLSYPHPVIPANSIESGSRRTARMAFLRTLNVACVRGRGRRSTSLAHWRLGREMTDAGSNLVARTPGVNLQSSLSPSETRSGTRVPRYPPDRRCVRQRRRYPVGRPTRLWRNGSRSPSKR
jgi:hypothetical protein